MATRNAGQARGRLQSQADKNADKAHASLKAGQVAMHVPGPGRPRIGSLLTARDTNARAGSRSSVSSQDGDRFYTASKELEVKHSDNYRKTKVYRSSKKTFKENIVPQVLVSVTDKGSCGASPTLRKAPEVVLNPAELGSSDATYIIEKLVSKLEVEEDVADEKCLPKGVLNIDIDEGLYEYSREAYEYLRDVEEAFVIPKDYLESSNITANMRMILVDWLTQVQHHLKLSQESLYLAVSILDTILHRRDVDADKLQLLGITALLLATKCEEYYPAEVEKLLHLTEDSYSRSEVVSMEKVIIQILDFKVCLRSIIFNLELMLSLF